MTRPTLGPISTWSSLRLVELPDDNGTTYAAIHFATLTTQPVIHNTDFIVLASPLAMPCGTTTASASRRGLFFALS
jgi:hypothetical protein